ncbi:hypothetical protein FOMPIDRAFT_1054291 [Fomitopsis schrenkii]|uniref:F-box domain-containing protein n=1 Tax=Fomitopsis schrenkii TaxID=2126942 RepID=S8DPR6_FOMSC|nr:hypothetical protein FOMPIDRAFT_1054291 [Fomitopsis schrenkii]
MNPFACLNDDVLNIILSLLSPSDAGKLAQTCRAAYTHAIPRYLSDVTLGLEVQRKPKSQLASFCHFILSGAPNRASFLRRVELRQEAFPWVEVEIKAKLGDPFGIRTNRDYSLASLLAEVIQQADGLEEVHVADADPPAGIRNALDGCAGK